jgi:hypothetical protein
MFIILVSSAILFATHNIVLGAIFGGVFVVFLAMLVLVNMFKSTNNQMLEGQDVNVKFDEQNLMIICSLNNEVLYSAAVEYSTIKSVKKSKELMFLYVNKNSAIVIPKASFASVEDYNKVIQLVQNNYVV